MVFNKPAASSSLLTSKPCRSHQQGKDEGAVGEDLRRLLHLHNRRVECPNIFRRKAVRIDSIESKVVVPRSATLANDRISGLGLYDEVKIITVYFESGSSILLQEAKEVIDRDATLIDIQKSQGYVVEVVGFADSTGTNEFNKQLSEYRTKSVIDYLVLKHSLPLQRLIRPFGYGSEKPAADNDSSDGRAKNRRVEIRVLVNRGIAGGD